MTCWRGHFVVNYRIIVIDKWFNLYAFSTAFKVQSLHLCMHVFQQDVCSRRLFINNKNNKTDCEKHKLFFQRVTFCQLLRRRMCKFFTDAPFRLEHFFYKGVFGTQSFFIEMRFCKLLKSWGIGKMFICVDRWNNCRTGVKRSVNEIFDVRLMC